MSALEYIGNVSRASYANHKIVGINNTSLVNTTEIAKYDRESDNNGAIMFIVLTLCIYSLGITAFIAGHIYKRSENKIMDLQISEFFSSSFVANLDQVTNMERIKVMTAKCRKFLNDEEAQNGLVNDCMIAQGPSNGTLNGQMLKIANEGDKMFESNKIMYNCGDCHETEGKEI